MVTNYLKSARCGIGNLITGFAMYKNTWDQQLQIQLEVARRDFSEAQALEAFQPVSKKNDVILDTERRIEKEEGIRQRKIWDLGANLGSLASHLKFKALTQKKDENKLAEWNPNYIPSVAEDLSMVVTSIAEIICPPEFKG